MEKIYFAEGFFVKNRIKFDKIAQTPIRIITVMYALVKVFFYMVQDSDFLLHRIILSIALIIGAFVITQVTVFSRRQLSIIMPMSLVIVEVTFIALTDGDPLTYFFLIGIPLISLLYIDIKGLVAVSIMTFVFVAFVAVGLDVRLLGPDTTIRDDLFSLTGLAVMYIMAYMLARFSISALESSQKAAEAATRSKSEFLATMSHEIRTPLNAIIGISQVQLQKPLPAGIQSDIEKIYSSGKNLLGIINDLLDMSKIETGKLDIIPVEYDTPSLLSDTVHLNIVRIGSKQIEFILDIEPNFPSKIFGDELRIKQILNNLLSNAIKYTESGFVKLTVKHGMSDGIIDLQFVVEDSGQGIKSQDLSRLFTEYTRFNTDTNYATEGTGLGLNITKNLVEMMEGEIDVSSEYGKGSTFAVSLKQSAVACRAIGEETAKQLQSFTFASKRIEHVNDRLYSDAVVLVVDDMETNLYVAQGMLDLYDVDMEAALSGKKAIEKVQRGQKFDIIFMDHMMPEMDGIETTKNLREMGYTGTIIALTANAIVGNAEMFKANGFDDFMSKPMDTAKLGTFLEKWIGDST
jgi:signal transduction histidine kinase/CheY-like chemotaxis protein